MGWVVASFLMGFFTGAVLMYIAFDHEIRSGVVTLGNKIYATHRYR